MLTAVVGTNWGDEGKGRMVDLLGEQYDIVVRYQGGNNAGHTVVNNKGKFILNLMPSGIFRETTVNVMGGGMAIDIEHLVGEIESLREKGIAVTPKNLKVSSRAVICMPYHKELDNLEEDRLGDAKQGSTRRGIGPVYSDKYMRKALRMGDLLRGENDLRALVGRVVEWKNLLVHDGYKAPAISADDMFAWLERFGAPLCEFICDTSDFLEQAIYNKKNIMFEAQLGALRDIDLGIYPFTSSSSTMASYAPIGAGIPFAKLDKVVGIMKAYSSSVGGGPFVAEFLGEEGDRLREAGSEYGAATGRPRRVGAFDFVASRYGARMQGCTEVAVTKLDILSYLDRIPVCVAYDIDGRLTSSFPDGTALERAKPVYEYVPGFGQDISHCRKKSDLPKEAVDFIRFIERGIACPIKYVSVGAEREQCIML